MLCKLVTWNKENKIDDVNKNIYLLFVHLNKVNLKSISSKIGAKKQDETNAIKIFALNKFLTISSLLGMLLVIVFDIISWYIK